MLTDKQCEVISALAFSGMSVAEAARKLKKGESTIRHHITAIRLNTGLNPEDFFDLYDLYQMAGGAE